MKVFLILLLCCIGILGIVTLFIRNSIHGNDSGKSPRFRRSIPPNDSPDKNFTQSDYLNMLDFLSIDDSTNAFVSDFINYQRRSNDFKRANLNGYKFIQLRNGYPSIKFSVNLPRIACFFIPKFKGHFRKFENLLNSLNIANGTVHIEQIPKSEIVYCAQFLSLLGSYFNELIEESGPLSSEWSWNSSKCKLIYRSSVEISFSTEKNYVAKFSFKKLQKEQHELSPVAKYDLDGKAANILVYSNQTVRSVFEQIKKLNERSAIDLNYQNKVSLNRKAFILEQDAITTLNNTNFTIWLKSIENCDEFVIPEIIRLSSTRNDNSLTRCSRKYFEFINSASSQRLDSYHLIAEMHDYDNISDRNGTMVFRKASELVTKASEDSAVSFSANLDRYSKSAFPNKFCSLSNANKKLKDFLNIGTDVISEMKKIDFDEFISELEEFFQFALQIKYQEQ